MKTTRQSPPSRPNINRHASPLHAAKNVAHVLQKLTFILVEGAAFADGSTARRGNLRRLSGGGDKDVGLGMMARTAARRTTGAAIPLDGEFFLMFFLVLLVVFAVLLGPVVFKCIRKLFNPAKVGEGGLSAGGAEQVRKDVTKEELFRSVHIVKEKIERENRRVRSIRSERNRRVLPVRPQSGAFFGTYVVNGKLHGGDMELSFTELPDEGPDEGFEIRGKSGVQSGETVIIDGFLALDGAAYFVEVGGCNPNAIGKDVRHEELHHNGLGADDVSKLIVLYSGIFDFTQDELFKGWRHASTGKFRPYRLSLRPSEGMERSTSATDDTDAAAECGESVALPSDSASTRGRDGSENVVVAWSDRESS